MALVWSSVIQDVSMSPLISGFWLSDAHIAYKDTFCEFYDLL